MLRASKALKEERKALFDGRYEYIFNRLSDASQVDMATVEDMVIGGEVTKDDEIPGAMLADVDERISGLSAWCDSAKKVTGELKKFSR